MSAYTYICIYNTSHPAIIHERQIVSITSIIMLWGNDVDVLSVKKKRKNDSYKHSSKSFGFVCYYLNYSLVDCLYIKSTPYGNINGC